MAWPCPATCHSAVLKFLCLILPMAACLATGGAGDPWHLSLLSYALKNMEIFLLWPVAAWLLTSISLGLSFYFAFVPPP